MENPFFSYTFSIMENGAKKFAEKTGKLKSSLKLSKGALINGAVFYTDNENILYFYKVYFLEKNKIRLCRSHYCKGAIKGKKKITIYNEILNKKGVAFIKIKDSTIMRQPRRR